MILVGLEISFLPFPSSSFSVVGATSSFGIVSNTLGELDENFPSFIPIELKICDIVLLASIASVSFFKARMASSTYKVFNKILAHLTSCSLSDVLIIFLNGIVQLETLGMEMTLTPSRELRILVLLEDHHHCLPKGT